MCPTDPMPNLPLPRRRSPYVAWKLNDEADGATVESLASAVMDSPIARQPHQVYATLFACSNPVACGLILGEKE